MVELTLENQAVTIEEGELVSYQVGGYEIIHQKGSPGWRNADTEMFPIIGPTNTANFRVQTPNGEAVQDQHGLLRELEYTLVEKTKTTAIFEKKYTAGSIVKNSKFPAKSSEEFLAWPYTFVFRKYFAITAKGLAIEFHITGEENMPFMLGYHPAFKLNTKEPTLVTDTEKISLEEIKNAGNRALSILDCSHVTLVDSKKINITTVGFGNFMLWTEVDNMVCIEPITFYPYAVKQENLSKGFLKLDTQPSVFKVQISLV